MDRLSGAYKRNLKFIAIGVGCLVAGIVNGDSFAVGRALWSDSALRAEMVQAASTTVHAGPPSTDPGTGSAQEVAAAFAKANSDLRPLPIGWANCEDLEARAAEATADAQLAPRTTAAQVTKANEAARAATAALNAADCSRAGRGTRAWNLYWLYKIIGLFATGLALSLGAPFWFDTLSKFMNIRGAGAKPERQT
jgi:hypothetical protein